MKLTPDQEEKLKRFIEGDSAEDTGLILLPVMIVIFAAMALSIIAIFNLIQGLIE